MHMYKIERPDPLFINLEMLLCVRFKGNGALVQLATGVDISVTDDEARRLLAEIERRQAVETDAAKREA